MPKFKTPILLLAFRRPQLTSQVFAILKKLQPTNLLVACDGPRPDVLGEAGIVEQVKAIITAIDWPCNLKTNFSPVNLGCRQRISSAINWAFEHEEELIILEDDTLPDISFFDYCQNLLHRYRSIEEVMHIGGFNIAHGSLAHRHSYWFTKHAWIWGWATWRRAWSKYDYLMRSWDEKLPTVTASFANDWESHYWMPLWKQYHDSPETSTTWDYPWMFTVRANNGICILPTVNLVKNIGFQSDGTHTFPNNPYLYIKSGQYQEVDHPKAIAISRLDDCAITRTYAGEKYSLQTRLKDAIRIALRRTTLRRATQLSIQ